MLGGCGMDTKKEVITKAIESHLREKYGEAFEVLFWSQPKLLPSDNGVIHATCIAKNDPKHPFEGRYFYDEKLGLEEGTFGDGYAERLLAKQMEAKVEKVVSQVAEKYYIQGDITIPEEWQDIPVEEISQWENYVSLCNTTENTSYRTLGAVRVFVDVTTMLGKTDEEEYRMYEDVFREEMGGEALLYIYYMDKKNFQQAEEILEERAPRNGGSDLDEAKENQPYFGTIMRSGTDIFADSLEIFKAAKQGKEQEKYK